MNTLNTLTACKPKIFIIVLHLLSKDIQADDDADGLEIINNTSLVQEAPSNDQAHNNYVTNKPQSLEDFRKENKGETSSRQRFMVLREDGLEELKKDILGCYKNPHIKLRAKPRIKFEGDSGVGSGPVRKYPLILTRSIRNTPSNFIF